MLLPKKILLLTYALLCLYACNNSKNKDVVTDPNKMNKRVQQDIKAQLSNYNINSSKPTDSNTITYYKPLINYYTNTEFLPIWSNKKQLTNNALALLQYIDSAALQGLFKEDYNFTAINKMQQTLLYDSTKNSDAILWAKADILFTDAYLGLLKDLKQGRLCSDSASWKNDSSKYTQYFGKNITKLKNGDVLYDVLQNVQPHHKDYLLLKKGIKKFVDSMDNRLYTYLNYPYKDSLSFIKTFKKRLGEAGFNLKTNSDSTTLSNTVKKYQQQNGLVADGKVGAAVVKKLNYTDKQRFNSIAITLDKYKLLPEKMPEKYIWVNLPAYYLKLMQADTTVLESKVICGKVATPTPLITSSISDIVLYPTWTVPTSIISKDMLPGLKRNSGYLARRGLYLLNSKGQKINAAAINWGRYTKGIPFRVQQGSGDGNALGIIKFNFVNSFSVYLHDTNQRYLYKNAVRSLSHGCVRVQEWQKLADYIIRNDSMLLAKNDTLRANTDSVHNWLLQKRNKVILVKNKIPLYIRYFSCELVNGKIKFYDDMYGEDKDLKQRYLASK